MTDRYAVLGNPIAHSLSPQIHQKFAEETQQDMSYEKILVPEQGFFEKIEELKSQSYKGLNITLPFKQEAFTYCDKVSSRARAAEAVNTILFMNDGHVYGDNTDGVGLVTDIEQNYHFSLKDKTILLIGAGGAARGVIQPLLQTNPKKIVITNRTFEKALMLKKNFEQTGIVDAIAFSELDMGFDCIINATSMAFSNSDFPLPATIIKADSFCYDMMYGKQTQFMQFAHRHGAKKIVDGLGMLIEQAAEAFYLWRNIRPKTENMAQNMRILR